MHSERLLFRPKWPGAFLTTPLGKRNKCIWAERPILSMQIPPTGANKSTSLRDCKCGSLVCLLYGPLSFIYRPRARPTATCRLPMIYAEKSAADAKWKFACAETGEK
jgi:hypothetical protein